MRTEGNNTFAHGRIKTATSTYCSKYVHFNKCLLVGFEIDFVGNDRKMFLVETNDMCETVFIETYN